MGSCCSEPSLFELPPVKGEELIAFDREVPPRVFGSDFSMYAEGYWKDDSDPLYPLPIKRSPWVGEMEFIEKLQTVESRINVKRFRGCSTSRITGETLGNGEYFDFNFFLVWPEDLRTHYYELYHVKPSRIFYRYVHYVCK